MMVGALCSDLQFVCEVLRCEAGNKMFLGMMR